MLRRLPRTQVPEQIAQRSFGTLAASSAELFFGGGVHARTGEAMTDLWVLRSLPRGLDGSNYGAGAELFDDLPTRWPAYGQAPQPTPFRYY